MIGSVLLWSLGTFASPVIISEVRATREAGHLRVEVDGDGGIDPEQAHATIDEGRMFLYLGGTRVRADNRSWDLADGAGEIRAHRHRFQTELVIPLARNGCAGPVELAGSEHGITALVGCEGASAAASRPVVAGRRSPIAQPATRLADGGPTEDSSASRAADTIVRSKTAARGVATATAATAAAPAERDSPRTAAVATASPEDEKLKALVALPRLRSPSGAPGEEAAAADEDERAPEPRGPSREVVQAGPPKVAAEVDAPAGHPARAGAGTATASSPNVVRSASSTTPSISEPAPLAAPLPPAPISPPLGLAAVLPAPEAATARPETRSAGVAAPAIGLALLAGAAYVFARRRKGAMPRHIQILETASLGPKRSLVVARIGDETLFLGTSEAGVTLLKSTRDVPPVEGREPERATMATLSAAAEAADADHSDSASPFAAEGRPGTPLVHETDIPITEALADIPEPSGIDPTPGPRAGLRTIEGGLASLFGRRGSAGGAAFAGPRESRDQLAGVAFDDILEDSVEDQELRRKLAAGLSARAR